MNQFVGPPVGGLLAGRRDRARVRRLGARVRDRRRWPRLARGVVQAGPRRAEQTSIVADIREGLSYLFHHRVLRTLAIMVGIGNLARSAAFAVFVLYAV